MRALALGVAVAGNVVGWPLPRPFERGGRPRVLDLEHGAWQALSEELVEKALTERDASPPATKGAVAAKRDERLVVKWVSADRVQATRVASR